MLYFQVLCKYCSLIDNIDRRMEVGTKYNCHESVIEVTAVYISVDRLCIKNRHEELCLNTPVRYNTWQLYSYYFLLQIFKDLKDREQLVRYQDSLKMNSEEWFYANDVLRSVRITLTESLAIRRTLWCAILYWDIVCLYKYVFFFNFQNVKWKTWIGITQWISSH